VQEAGPRSTDGHKPPAGGHHTLMQAFPGSDTEHQTKIARAMPTEVLGTGEGGGAGVLLFLKGTGEGCPSPPWALWISRAINTLGHEMKGKIRHSNRIFGALIYGARGAKNIWSVWGSGGGGGAGVTFPSFETFRTFPNFQS
jgi:hypothetical protein